MFSVLLKDFKNKEKILIPLALYSWSLINFWICFTEKALGSKEKNLATLWEIWDSIEDLKLLDFILKIASQWTII